VIRDKQFYKTLLLIALPAAFQSLITLGVNMLDNVMVGSLGEIALSGVSLGNQLTTLMTFFVKGVAGGSAVLISQYWGKKDMGRIKTVFGIVFRFCLISSLLVALLVHFFPEAAMRIYTNEASIIASGAEFLAIVCFSYIFFTVSDTLIAMLRWMENVKVGVIVPIVSFFVNLFFNYILIFGKLGFPAMGVRGAAIATVITRAVELCVVVAYVFVFDKKLGLKPRDLLAGDRQMTRDFIRYSIPVTIGDMQWGLVGTFKATLIGRLGVTMVAAHSIAETVLSLAMIFTNGLANAACVVVGKVVGRGENDLAREYSKTIQILFAVIGVIVALFVFLIRAWPVSLYNVEAETAQLAAAFIGIGGLTLMGTCYHASCFVGINRGAGDGKFVMKVDMICGWLVVLPAIYLTGFVFHAPLTVVYLMTRIDQCFKWIIAFFRLRGDKWIHNVTR